ncbi:hypothetical protein M408DRAFT_120154 [Serendipita vermifera MAFF 305830]|uniref:Uncharacterized protein n=1 Tax=Serendipita vermifera MAFF 305830 TaxID=933852 RepID=A0A0C2XJG6_SERVB|nr:hypothetical protein M408DRAFT_120154 [Serendipita vermifera MAFF 305830]
MTAGSNLAKELLRIGKSWPPDILRPRLQYGNYLVALAQSKQLEKRLTPGLVRSQQLLLENSLKEKYALSDKTLHPASYPDKYSKLVGLLEEAVATNEASQDAKSKGFWAKLLRR